MQTQDDIRRLVDSGVVAVMRGVDREVAVDVARALRAGGVTAIEVTADTPDAMATVGDLRDAFEDESVIVGAGTVLDAETARSAQLAGAEFVVAPTFDRELVEACNRYGVPVAPGVATPTEALNAFEAGADIVKVFPAKSFGPGYVSAIKGPLEQIPIMPTGGVDASNAGDYIRAGAACVGAGGALIDAEAIAAGDWETLTANAEELVTVVEQARG